MAGIYFDTTLIIGYFENQHNRKQIVESLIKEHQAAKDEIFTSILTYHELLTGPYCMGHQVDTNEYFRALNDFATVVTINPEIASHAAQLIALKYGSKLSEIISQRRFFRWDAFHLATANHLKVATAYTFDSNWASWNRNWLPNIGKIVSDPKPNPALGI